MIVDGRALASSILKSVKETLGERRPLIRIIAMQPSAATESYLRIKQSRASEAGMDLEVVRIENDGTTEDVIRAVTLPGADAVVVQLPLPGHVDARMVCNAIPKDKDADVLSESAYEAFVVGEADALLPPVVGAIEAILETANVSPVRKRVAVVGHGKLVGEPAAVWFSRFGPVDQVTRDATTLQYLKEADIVVSGAGHAGLIQPSMLTEGVVLVDAGTSESGGAVRGDADPSVASVASVFTPVPGGVGPVAVACLFKNVASLL